MSPGGSGSSARQRSESRRIRPRRVARVAPGTDADSPVPSGVPVLGVGSGSAHGKEGVDGSSPSEGSRGRRCYRPRFAVAGSASSSFRPPAGYPVGSTPSRTASRASRMTSTAGRLRAGSTPRRGARRCPDSARLVAELRRDLEDVQPFEDQEAGEAAVQVASDRVSRKADLHRRGPEDALAPVVPVAGRPLAEHGLIVARTPAPDPELGEQDRPVILDAGDGVTEVSFQDATYAVSDHDLAEVGAARLGPESGLPAEVRAALRWFA